jgi:hypothetical protein
MTAIAYRDGTLAADTISWAGSNCNVKINMGKKIHRLLDGGLVAASGYTRHCEVYRNWMLHCSGDIKQLDNEPEFDKNFHGVWIKPDKTIWACERTCKFMQVFDEFYAIGSPIDFMYGALHAGASAFQTIHLAIKNTDGAGGEVQTEHLYS